MRRLTKPCCLTLLASFLLSAVPPWAMAADPSSASGHAFHSNHLAFFAGFSGEVRRERAFSLGLDYERRISESFGVGALVERANGDRDFWIAAIPFSWHRGHWKFSIALGVEHEKGHDDHGLLRLGAGYAFEMDGFEVAPLIAVDFVDGDTVSILGVTVGRGF